MKVTILNPYGYCFGVTNAISTAYKAKKEHPNKKICVLGMLIHNNELISVLEKDNIHTISNLNEISTDDVVVLPAHGYIKAIKDELIAKNFVFYDATCPKVNSNIELIKKAISSNRGVIYIGLENHPETKAALSIDEKVVLYNKEILKNYYSLLGTNPLVINQTTLNFESLKDIHNDILSAYPNAEIVDEICNATRIRQEAIVNLSNDTDAIVIVGDKISSNTNKLLELAKKHHFGAKCILVASANDKILENLKENKNIVVAGGTSTSESTILEVYNKICSLIK